MSKISIIIPVYNGEKYLRECLDSVVNQTLKDIEIICIEDASTDNTPNILKEYAQNDSRIKILEQKEQITTGKARNIAMDIASGEYIMFVDADDWLELNACELLYEKIKKNNNEVVFFNMYNYYEKQQEKFLANRCKAFLNEVDNEHIKISELSEDIITNGMGPCHRIYNKNFLKEHQICFSDTTAGEDVPFSYKIFLLAKDVSVLNEPLYTYRHHRTMPPKRMTARWEDHYINYELAYDLYMQYGKEEKYFKPYLLEKVISEIVKRFYTVKRIDKSLRAQIYNRTRQIFKKISKENDISTINNQISKYVYYLMILRLEDYRLYELFCFLYNIHSFVLSIKKKEKDSFNKYTIQIMGIRISFRVKNNLLRKIFSIQQRSDDNGSTHTVINIFGLKIKTLNKLKNCIIIVGPGGIGDYMLCRPYFKYLKESPKFKNCNFIYLCKNAYQDMVKVFDNDVFVNVVTFDKNYKTVKKALKKYEIHTLISLFTLHKENGFKGWSTRYNLIKTLKIKKKIIDVLIKTKEDLKNPNLKIFNEFIVSDTKSFELDRRRLFFEKLTEVKIPYIAQQLSPFIDFSKKYICCSLFTNCKKRDYDNGKWINVINYLLGNISQDTQLLFLGGNKDRVNIQKILDMTKKPSRCINFAGLSNISLVPSILKNAELLIALDTGTVHIAESVNCPTICISCGLFYGRYLPYNTPNILYIFPDEFDKLIEENNTEKLGDFYSEKWTYSVKDISSEKIIKKIDEFLSNNTCQTTSAISRREEICDCEPRR